MSEITVFDGIDGLKAAVGQKLGYSDWLEMTQDRIDLFAEATGDHQWIHVDAERAATGPFGRTIAHGYLTLSLISYFVPQLLRVENVSMGLNYGLDKVRFPAPVPVGSKVRATSEILSVEDVPGGVQVKSLITMEVEGGSKPVCVAESLGRYLS